MRLLHVLRFAPPTEGKVKKLKVGKCLKELRYLTDQEAASQRTTGVPCVTGSS